MFMENEFSIFDFVYGISGAVDLVSPALNNHHQKVAYISYGIAKEMGLAEEEIKDIVLASIVHDIGAFSTEERLQLIEFEVSKLNHHALSGYMLLKNFEPLASAATLVRYHHENFDESRDEIPMGSYIIHLADRISVLLDERHEVLERVPEILAQITQNQTMFHPDALLALHRMAKIEYFWIEACSPTLNSILSQRMRFSKKIMDLDALRSFAKLIAQIIDFRSRFTSTHSSGVAAVALELAVVSGFSERECKLMEIAGFLHDLGKLAVSNDVLEKNGALNHEEYNIMRKHTYYTYAVLNKIKGFEQIAMWAAYHHERLDGNGYPFHVKGEDFSKLARIMAVADILTAITEDRPYRLGMSSESALKILSDMVENGGIDKAIVTLVEENFPLINDVRIKAQQTALQEYIAFNSFGSVPLDPSSHSRY